MSMNDWFWARAMATEGDLTVGQATLNTVAADIAKDFLNNDCLLNYNTAEFYCVKNGFHYNSLLEEEKDYLDKKVEELIN